RRREARADERESAKSTRELHGWPESRAYTDLAGSREATPEGTAPKEPKRRRARSRPRFRSPDHDHRRALRPDGVCLPRKGSKHRWRGSRAWTRRGKESGCACPRQRVSAGIRNTVRASARVSATARCGGKGVAGGDCKTGGDFAGAGDTYREPAPALDFAVTS